LWRVEQQRNIVSLSLDLLYCMDNNNRTTTTRTTTGQQQQQQQQQPENNNNLTTTTTGQQQQEISEHSILLFQFIWRRYKTIKEC